MADELAAPGGRHGSLRRVLPGALRIAVVACAALAVGCAVEKAKHERDADLQLISDWLPGHYNNEAQIAEDRRLGRVPHDAFTLSIVQVHAGEIGVQMFYLQEMTSGAREIKLQRLISMGITNDKVVATMWSFTDPPRWREGDTTPELFTSLQPPDLKVMRGCNLVWKKQGDQFTASNELGKCDPTVSRAGFLQYLDMRITLSADELALIVREIDSHGNASSEGVADPYIRFRRSPGS
jgi:hypothetical protein